MKKLVFLTGAGMSAESGLSTFRDSDGLWEQHRVEDVATHEAWLNNRNLVNRFYNERRRQLISAKPNEGHWLVAQLEQHYDVTVITQNVDNLHEQAGSTNVIHLHGELMKACSSRDVDDTRYHVQFTPEHYEVKEDEKAGDGSYLRPYIVFFGEAVPNIGRAADVCTQADILVIIGTSLVVYPAAQLVYYTQKGIPIYLIDPKDEPLAHAPNLHHIRKGASEGMKELTLLFNEM